MHIRSATPEDAGSLLAIYAPYVRETAITFEYEPPSLAEFERRVTCTLERYPYLVAVADEDGGTPGEILGYAYAGRFQERPAYDWTVETSLYVARDRRRGGVGSALHAALRADLARRGFQSMCACIATVPEGVGSDPHLTDASVRFHEHLGYRMVGRFSRCGYKFDRWYDMVWMELLIGSHPVPAPRLSWQA